MFPLWMFGGPMSCKLCTTGLALGNSRKQSPLSLFFHPPTRSYYTKSEHATSITTITSEYYNFLPTPPYIPMHHFGNIQLNHISPEPEEYSPNVNTSSPLPSHILDQHVIDQQMARHPSEAIRINEEQAREYPQNIQSNHVLEQHIIDPHVLDQYRSPLPSSFPATCINIPTNPPLDPSSSAKDNSLSLSSSLSFPAACNAADITDHMNIGVNIIDPHLQDQKRVLQHTSSSKPSPPKPSPPELSVENKSTSSPSSSSPNLSSSSSTNTPPPPSSPNKEKYPQTNYNKTKRNGFSKHKSSISHSSAISSSAPHSSSPHLRNHPPSQQSSSQQTKSSFNSTPIRRPPSPTNNQIKYGPKNLNGPNSQHYTTRNEKDTKDGSISSFSSPSPPLAHPPSASSDTFFPTFSAPSDSFFPTFSAPSDSFLPTFSTTPLPSADLSLSPSNPSPSHPSEYNSSLSSSDSPSSYDPAAYDAYYYASHISADPYSSYSSSSSDAIASFDPSSYAQYYAEYQQALSESSSFSDSTFTTTTTDSLSPPLSSPSLSSPVSSSLSSDTKEAKVEKSSAPSLFPPLPRTKSPTGKTQPPDYPEFLVELPKEKTLRAFNDKIESAMRGGHLRACMDIYAQMRNCAITPNLATYDMLFSAHVRTPDALRVNHLFAELLAHKLAPTVETYNIILAANETQPAYCDVIYAHMRAANIAPDVDTARKLIFAHLRNTPEEQQTLRRTNEILWDLCTALSPSSSSTSSSSPSDSPPSFPPSVLPMLTDIFNKILGAVPAHAMSHVYAAMRTHKVPANVVTFNTLMREPSHNQDPTAHEDALLEEMLARGIALNAVTYNTLITHAAQRKDVERSKAFYQAMLAAGVEPELPVYKALTLLMAKMGDHEFCWGILKDMKERGWS